MACGEFGEGKMTEPNDIIDYLDSYFKNIKKNNKYKALVTAGPTHEYIDPVRFISNNSSGKQGYAIAEEFKKNGANVTLISGPTNLTIPSVDKLIQVNTADEMLNATLKCLPYDIFIMKGH